MDTNPLHDVGNKMMAQIAGMHSIQQAQQEAGRRMRAAAEAQIAMPKLLSGYATWDAMQSALEQLRRVAPKDHDVVIKVSDVTVVEAYFIEPHAFLFEGYNDVGENTWIGLHFSQLVFAVIHRPKSRPEPVITGFCPHAPSA
jgi:hypothetical protein